MPNSLAPDHGASRTHSRVPATAGQPLQHGKSLAARSASTSERRRSRLCVIEPIHSSNIPLDDGVGRCQVLAVEETSAGRGRGAIDHRVHALHPGVTQSRICVAASSPSEQRLLL
ncbi:MULTISPECIES: hypothetical protein [Rhodococcus]|uniref:hypothetical protein n=1 Tax=Rhodococcus TaxID=1827 RepID=UPI0011B2407C|nr:MULTISPECIES: hypothetical protein [Rhodococcus]MCE4267839.1 hypothetical protein [Rhodococcus globerulus]